MQARCLRRRLALDQDSLRPPARPCSRGRASGAGPCPCKGRGARLRLHEGLPPRPNARMGLSTGKAPRVCSPGQEGRGFWRRHPESNRGTRICNPLRHHSAMAPSRSERKALANQLTACNALEQVRCSQQGLRRFSALPSCKPQRYKPVHSRAHGCVSQQRAKLSP